MHIAQCHDKKVNIVKFFLKSILRVNLANVYFKRRTMLPVPNCGRRRRPQLWRRTAMKMQYVLGERSGGPYRHQQTNPHQKRSTRKRRKLRSRKKSRDLLPMPCMPSAPFIGLLYLFELKINFRIKLLQLIKTGLHKSLLSNFEMKLHCL